MAVGPLIQLSPAETRKGELLECKKYPFEV